MADAKKYYYMRLNENYFDSDEQILLESMTDGYLYSNILLKLYLKSLKRDGLLMFNDRIPYNAQMIASITRHQIGTVEKALQLFREMGIVEVLDSGAIYMLDVQNFVGKTSTEADRIREYRLRIEKEKSSTTLLENPSCTNVQQTYTKDRDKDRDKDKDRDRDIHDSASAASKPTRHKYGYYQNVLLSDDELEKLKTEFSEDWESRIERLSEYIASKGAKYKNHLATIRAWSRKEVKTNAKHVRSDSGDHEAYERGIGWNKIL